MKSFVAALRPYRVVLVLGAVYLLVGALLRAVLWARFGTDAAVSVDHLPAIFAAGVANDWVQALYLLFPFALAGLAIGKLGEGKRLRVVFQSAAFYLFMFGALFVAAAEYFFFEEFDSRFNLVAVDYLVYPTEVIGNIEDSYPIGMASLGIALACAVLLALLWRPSGIGQAVAYTRRERLPGLVAHTLLLVPMLAVHSTHDLGIRENRVANELAANGISSFFGAARTHHIDYHAHYRSGDPQKMLDLLTANLSQQYGHFIRLPQGQITRRYPARAQGLGKLNVVVVAEESLGAEYVGAYGDDQGLTPEFDALSTQGILFANAYASGTRTVRGLEAISASIPPIPGESILKRQGSADIMTWGEVMQQLGYHSSFLYGGYGYFDNMSAYFAGNGFDTSDRADIPEPHFANIWGVSDGDLFAHALKYFDQRHAEGRPFFSIVLTTSNHPPYTFPADAPVPPKRGGRQAGVHYADHALGEFIRAARAHPWFENTLFVIVADHGARVYGAAEIPLRTYEIPMLFYSPAHLKPRKVETLTGQMDIAPTVLGLLGVGYEAPFFGEDVLGWTGGSRTLPFNHNHKVAIYRDGELAILGLQGEAQSVRHHWDINRPVKQRDVYTPIPPDQSLIDLATAYYQTAYDLFQSRRYQ